MEIILQHTNEIYKNIIQGIAIILLFSIPAIVQLIKCKRNKEKYGIEYIATWILPAIFLFFLLVNAVPYMIDYTFDRIDTQIIYIEDADRNNAGSNLISGRYKFHVSRADFIGDEDVSDIIEEYVVGHTCEIESYMSSNNVIRIKVLD